MPIGRSHCWSEVRCYLNNECHLVIRGHQFDFAVGVDPRTTLCGLNNFLRLENSFSSSNSIICLVLLALNHDFVKSESSRHWVLTKVQVKSKRRNFGVQVHLRALIGREWFNQSSVKSHSNIWHRNHFVVSRSK